MGGSTGSGGTARTRAASGPTLCRGAAVRAPYRPLAGVCACAVVCVCVFVCVCVCTRAKRVSGCLRMRQPLVNTNVYIIYMYVCGFVCLSVCLSLCLSVCMYVYYSDVTCLGGAFGARG